MKKKKLVRPIITTLVGAGAAIAAPPIAPYLLAPLAGLIGSVVGPKVSELIEELGEGAADTVSSLLVNVVSSAIWEGRNKLGSKENEDLTRVLAHAYRDALERAKQEIKQTADPDLKEQTQTIDLIKARVARTLADDSEIKLMDLFPPSAVEQGSQSRSFANLFSSEQFILELANGSLSTDKILQNEIDVCLRRWLNEEIVHNSKELTLGLSQKQELPEPLREWLVKNLAETIPTYLGRELKEDDLKDSWIAFQRAHLQAILKEAKANKELSAENRELLSSLVASFDELAKSDFPQKLADATSEILMRLDESVEDIKQHIDDQGESLREYLDEIETRFSRTLERSIKPLLTTTSTRAERIAEVKSLFFVFKQVEPKGVQRFTYYSAQDHFAGRSKYVDQLRSSLLSPPTAESQKFQYCYIFGQAGVGKSRLAYELVSAVKQDWPLGGIVKRRTIGEAFECLKAKDWTPPEPTFMVIDYAAEAVSNISLLLASLAQRCESFEYPLRILLLARSSHSLKEKLIVPGSEGAVVEDYGLEEIELPGLDPVFCRAIMRGRIAAVGGTQEDFSNEDLDRILRTIDNEGRPLWAALIGHLLGKNPNFLSERKNSEEYTLQQDCLREILKHERLIWKNSAADIFGGQNPDLLRRKHERLLALATMTRGALLKIAFSFANHVPDLLPTRNEFKNFFYEIMSDYELKRRDEGFWLRPLEPDLLGEAFVDFILSDEECSFEETLRDLAWQIHPFGMAEFVALFEFDFGLPHTSPLRFFPDEPPTDQVAREAVSLALKNVSFPHIAKLLKSEGWSNPSSKPIIIDDVIRNQMSNEIKSAGEAVKRRLSRVFGDESAPEDAGKSL